MESPTCARPHCRRRVRGGGSCWQHEAPETASYGITPFRGVGRVGEEVSLSDPYYGTPRYGHFEAALYREADAAGVSVEDEPVRALGLWEGTNEPSAAVTVRGGRADIERVALAVGERFGQQAVRVIYTPGDGRHRRYRFALPDGEDPARTLSVLQEAGVLGARVTAEEVDLADAADLGPRQLAVLQRFYGSLRVEPCEVVRVMSRSPQRSTPAVD